MGGIKGPAARTALLALAALAARAGAREACTQEQLDCMDRARAAVQGEREAAAGEGQEAVCALLPALFQDLAGCAGIAGCDGADLHQDADACEEIAESCGADCGAIAAAPGAQALDEPVEMSQAAPAAGWPMVGFRPADEAAETDGAFNFTRQWDFTDAAGTSGLSPVPLPNGWLVTVGANGSLYCVDVFGVERWSLSPSDQAGEASRIVSQPVVSASGHIFVGDTSGALYQVSASAGDVLARWELGRPILAAPAVASDYVYVVSKGIVGFASTLHKIPLSAEARATWRAPVCTQDDLRLDWAVEGLVLAGDSVFAACAWQGVVEKFDLVSGALLGSAALGAAEPGPQAALRGAPVLGPDGSAYVVSATRGLIKLNSTMGEEWVIGGLSESTGRVVLDSQAGTGFALSLDGKLHRFDTSLGKILDTRNLGATASGAHPLLDSAGNVFAATTDSVVVLNNVTLDESALVDAPSALGAVLAGGKLYVSTADAAISQLAAFASVSLAPTSSPTSSPSEQVVPAPTSAPTSAPVSAPVSTLTGSPSAAPTAAPNITEGEEEEEEEEEGEATAGPTSSPTVNKFSAPRDGLDDDDHDHGLRWPDSAIITVSVLAVLDVLLIGAHTRRKLKKKKISAETDSHSSGSGSGVEAGDIGEKPPAPTPTASLANN